MWKGCSVSERVSKEFRYVWYASAQRVAPACLVSTTTLAAESADSA